MPLRTPTFSETSSVKKAKARLVTGRADPLEVPAYGLAEAARYVRLSPATLRTWVAGRRYPRRDGTGTFKPLIALPSGNEGPLSFSNLVEAHVLRALRTEHGVSISAVRRAIDFAQRELGIERLLLSPELRAGAGELLLEKYGELIDLTRSGQLAMKKILNAYLSRIQWDESLRPSRLYPIARVDLVDESRRIAIDPRIAFGRPVILQMGISTAAIAARIDAGEQVGELAADYDLTPADIEDAVVYERAA